MPHGNVCSGYGNLHHHEKLLKNKSVDIGGHSLGTGDGDTEDDSCNIRCEIQYVYIATVYQMFRGIQKNSNRYRCNSSAKQPEKEVKLACSLFAIGYSCDMTSHSPVA